MKRTRTILKGFVLLILVFSFTGCDTLEGINPFNNEKEVSGVIEAIGDNSLTVDGIEYAVTGDTEFDGISGLDELAVGDEVEIEYEERNGGREAVEVELAGADDDD
jgi:PDZ domain-containing secreted protein